MECKIKKFKYYFSELVIISILVLNFQVIGQSLVDPYEDHLNQTLTQIVATSNMYDGEFQPKFYSSNITINGNQIALSYSLEVVSFPFIPTGFFTTGDANTSGRNLIIPSQNSYDENNVACGRGSVTGSGWNQILYNKTSNIPFLKPNGFFNEITLASYSYTQTTGASCQTNELSIPNTVIKITINFHDGPTIASPILYSIPYFIDNTRGRLRYYPFIGTNSSGAMAGNYDFLILPKIETLTNLQQSVFHYYNTTSNSTLYTGGTINYFSHLNVDNYVTNNPLYPQPQDYSNSFFNIDFTAPVSFADYLYPAPYCLPNIEIRNSDGSAYVGYLENTGALSPGIQHTYTIDKTIDINIINPKDKIIFNPSEANIDIQDGNHSLTFPTGYTFKTINGLFPTVAMVNNEDLGNLYRDKRKVNVSNSGFQNSANQHHSIYNVKSGSTLIIEPCVTLVDVDIIVENGGFVNYDQSKTTLTNAIIKDYNGTINGIGINENYTFTGSFDCKCECYKMANYNNYNGVYNQDIQISQNTSWTTANISSYFNTSSNIINVPGNITVKSGYTLTIDQGLSFQFSEVAKIIVEKGAKLIVNGVQGNEVEFTSACNNLWEGIEVWGDKTASQLSNPISSTQQGYVELNYTSVSNALTGILAGQRDNLTTISDKLKAGGVIIANHSTFENNGISIEFLPYQSFMNNFKLPNYSIFNSCTFKTTELLKDQILYPKIAGTQIKLNQVHFYGNNIKNCIFYTDKTKFEPANRGIAIEGHKSSLRLFYSYPSTFEGFTEAILIENSNDGEKVYVDNCTFDNNIHSIVMDGVSYLRLYRNNINIPNSENFGYANATVYKRGYDNPVGIYMRYCQMNDLQENTITGNNPNSGLPYSIGIISNSTTGIANTQKKISLAQQQKAAATNTGFGRMYKNSISGLSYSIQGELNNSDNQGFSINPSSFLPQNGVGEQYKCNNLYSNLKSDVFLIGKTVSTGGNPYTLKGEFRTQGICSGSNGPAGNEFNSPNADYNIDREFSTSKPYFYNYYNDYTTPSSSETNFLNKCNTINSNSNTCPDLLSVPCTDLTCLKTILHQKIDVVASISQGLKSALDGDNTEGLINIIKSSNDNEIHDALLNSSPFLSDEVILALINKEIKIDEGYFTDIIIANCGLSDTIITVLEEYEFSSANRELINASINNLSERSKLYMELNNALFELNLARMDVINFGLDNVNESNNLEILDELQLENDLRGKYRQFDWLMQSSLYIEAETLLNSIASLEGEDKSNRYKLAEINLALINQLRLTYDQYSVLTEIVDSMPYSSIPAQRLLRYYGRKTFERAPLICTDVPERKAKSETFETFKNKELNIYPNPTSGGFTIAFADVSSGELQLHSVNDNIIKSYNVFSRREIKINASMLSKGMYILVFIPIDNSRKLFYKLIIH